jgi:hypothetical protein
MAAEERGSRGSALTGELGILAATDAIKVVVEVEVVEGCISVDDELDDALLSRSNLLRCLQRVRITIVSWIFPRSKHEYSCKFRPRKARSAQLSSLWEFFVTLV